MKLASRVFTCLAALGLLVSSAPIAQPAQTDGPQGGIEISGYGPTDTRYFDPANDPRPRKTP